MRWVVTWSMFIWSDSAREEGRGGEQDKEVMMCKCQPWDRGWEARRQDLIGKAGTKMILPWIPMDRIFL